jgi:hypothetical protein
MLSMNFMRSVAVKRGIGIGPVFDGGSSSFG